MYTRPSAGLTVVLLALTGLVGLDTAAVAATAQPAPPAAVIERTASALASKLEGKQDYFTAHTAELNALVDDLLLPGFDVTYASKLVLGRDHWMAATAEQRERFAQAFYGFLVRTYAKGLLGFDQTKMTIDPQPRYSKDGNKALVRTRLALAAGAPVEINYALRNSAGAWKMYDVRIDGVSYIQNYRNQFDAEISSRGIQAVIERLEAEDRRAAGGETDA
ncbi:MAG: ABC transporter substrate-binding protein [Gammaproteobacteria bacterium]|jgi:phospholipid transport system substrate-binding protein|nr:ABC transporter substrate-binding protein [Gammaproteobacteria bacterium]